MKSIDEIKTVEEAMIHGFDPHRWKASILYSTDYAEVSEKQRQEAKAQNFFELYSDTGQIPTGTYVVRNSLLPARKTWQVTGYHKKTVNKKLLLLL